MAQPVKYQGVDKQSSGYKLLAAMGWQEGSGLGARQQGIKEHVKVKKKHDSTGVGAVEAIAKARDWTAGMAAYDLVLAKMKSVGTASLPTQGSAKKKRKQPESNSPLAAAQPPATDRTHRISSKVDKKKKKAKAAAATIASSNLELPCQPAAPKTALPSPVVQVVTVQQPAPAQRSRGRHVGRYHKTTAAKKAGSYSKSDLAAILGVDSFPTAAPVSLATAAQMSSEDQESNEDTTFEPQEAAAAPSGQQSEGQSAQPAVEEAPEVQDGSLWWHGMFIRAGRMGNMASDIRSDGQEQGKKVQINGFSEQDQENLYMATQAGKSAGKKGLGKSSQGKPIGGAKWEGTKTAFDGDEEDKGAAAADADKDADIALAARMKWKKRAKRALEAAGGKMKLKKLQKQLLQESLLPTSQQTDMLNDMTKQLMSSRLFALAGSSIALA